MKESSFISKTIAKVKDSKKTTKIDRTIEKDSRKKIVFFSWSIVILLFLCSIGSIFISVSGIVDKNKINGNEIKPNKVDLLNYPAIENYLNPFVDKYMNVTADIEQNKKRQEELSLYLIQSDTDNSKLFELGQVQGERILNKKNVYSIEQMKNTIQVQYVIDYKNVTFSEKEIVKKVKVANKEELKKEKVTVRKEEPKTAILSIQITEKGGVYAVNGAPYFTNIYSLKGEIKQKGTNENKDEYTGAKKEKIEAFMTEFFTKYTTSNLEDLTYIMKNPESVNNVFLLESVDSILIFKDNDKFRVDAVVSFVDVSGVTTKQGFLIGLSEKNGHFYVEYLKHK
ncbi:conjugal transfer protein [Listeria booriae]|uniref:conjugal transfer protein n=1 Tax=Listeria booriae TaxID=1552123 RepID=UPI0028805395|nr:conjugal transfer protein [Listeria booriae]MDT0109338.1 conjugal transfer protein [Listeria booriae]